MSQHGPAASRRRLTRRRVLGIGAGGLVAVTAAGAGALELVARGVLPGQAELDRLDGACSVAGPPLTSDPFYPGARALAGALPPGAVTDFSAGCHSFPFFTAQEPPSLAFLGAHLTAAARR